MKRVLVPTLIATAAALWCGLALSKLPAPDPAAKAKADETAAKTAWQGKVDAYQLCKVQDKVAAAYKASAKSKGASAPAAPSTPVAAASAASAAKPAASGATAAASAASGASTPVASAAPPACADPGPFAYNAPEQKPLETSGAHSPAGNATSPPSVNQESAKMAPAKKT